MGWMAREKQMSDDARPMMKTCVALMRCRRFRITKITRKLAIKEAKTKKEGFN